MDPISFAASLITLVEVSTKVIAYLQGVQQGGKAREKLLNELTVLSFVLRSFKADFDPPPPTGDEPWMQPLKALIEPEGHGILEQIRQELTDLEKKLTGTSTRVGKAWSTLRWPFEEKQALQMIERIHRLKDTVTLVLSQSSQQMNREVLSSVQNLTSAAEDNQFQNVLNWLSPFNSRQKQQEIRGNAESFSWILQDKKFLSWHLGDRPSLWCHGPPGAGKSVLAASLFDEIMRLHKDHQKVAVLVAFCSFDNESYQKPQSVVASLLKQVAQIRGRLSQELKEEHAQSLRQDGTKPDLNRLKQLLRKELENFETTFIIFDGLDETSNVADRAAIVAALHACGPSAKVLVTSRFSEDIATSMANTMRCQRCHSHSKAQYWRCSLCEDHVLCESCRNKAVDYGDPEGSHQGVRQSSPASILFRPKKGDIRKYVRMRIETDTGLKRMVDAQDGLGATIISTVVARSEKLFLLARLHMDSLADCFRVFDLRRELASLSGDLSEIYAQALQRMRRSRSHGQQKILDKMLMWISWAKRPLTLQELGHAMSIVPGLGSISQDLILPSDTIRDITTWTAGLIFVDTRSLVRFIHPTTARFFSQHRERLFPNGDTHIAHACLDYLDISSVREPLPEKDRNSHFRIRLRQFPFMEYAVLCSWQHVARSAPKDDDHRATVFLQSQQARDFLTEALYFLDPSWSVGDDASPVHIASHFGLADVLASLLSAGEDADARDSFGATPLMYAVQSREDSLPCVRELLSAGADASLRCQRGSTALIRAVWGENESIVDCLLEVQDVAINTLTTTWREQEYSALLLSVFYRNEEIFRKLLGRPDIEVNARTTSTGHTALHYAAMRVSYSWALEGLLARPDIDVNIESADKYTPLLYAAAAGLQETAQQLLDKGADLKHLDSSRGSILMRAVDSQKSDMALFLIEKGSDINHRDFLGRNALHSAAINRAWGCLEVLLKDPAAINVNCQGTYGETPLHDACRTRDATGVMLLVTAGARCDIRDSEGRTPVDIAKLNEATDALKILEAAAGYKDLSATRSTKPLLDAVVFDNAEVLEERIQSANPEELNGPSAFDGPPISRACSRGRAHVVRMLLRAGADPEVTNHFGRTPLFFAITGGNKDCVDALISAGVDINRPPCLPEPDLPWELALRDREAAIAFTLIKSGAIIPRSSAQIQKALLMAAADDNLTVVRRLVEKAGASIYLKTRGSSAVQIAEEYKATRILSYFAERLETQRVPAEAAAASELDHHSTGLLTSDTQEDEEAAEETEVPGLGALRNLLKIRAVPWNFASSGDTSRFLSASIVALALSLSLWLFTGVSIVVSMVVCTLTSTFWLLYRMLRF